MAAREYFAALLLTVALAGCETLKGEDASDVGSSAPSDGDAVAFYQDLVRREPNVMNHRRELAAELARVQRYDEAAQAWGVVVNSSDAQAADRDELLAALVQLRRWDQAQQQLDALADQEPTERRLLLAGLVHDNTKNWLEADFAYSRLFVVSSRPAIALNNWGVSKLARGDYEGAVENFKQAIEMRADTPNAQVNLALANGFLGDYALPAKEMSAVDRARIFHDFGVIASKRGETEAARNFFEQAVAIHPQQYPLALDKLQKLNQGASVGG